MRPVVTLCVVVATAAAVTPPTAEACTAPDYTYITSGGALVAEVPQAHGVQEIRMLPSRPSVYVHPGEDSGNRMPTFTNLDGSNVPTRRSTPAESSEPWQALVRVDLDIEAGIVLAQTPDRDLPEVYIVSPAFVPTTRFAAPNPYMSGCLAVESDAALFRLDRLSRFGRVSEHQPDWRCVWLGDDAPVRVVAIYPDGRSEVIFHRRAESDDVWEWAPALLLLACLRPASLLVA
jgi:hypothetical protein